MVKCFHTIDMALAHGLTVKINCVPILNFNEDDLAGIAALAKERKIAVRFCELMPLGAAVEVQRLPINKAAGVLKPCLASDLSIDLRRLIKDGASDTEIETAVRELAGKKPVGHCFGAAGEKAKHCDTEFFRIGGREVGTVRAVCLSAESRRRRDRLR